MSTESIVTTVAEPVAPVVAPVPTPDDTTKPTLTSDEMSSLRTKAFGYAMNMVDEALAEMGHEKPKDIKTTDYIKQVLSERGTKDVAPLVTPITDTTDSEARIKALQKQLEEKDRSFVELTESTGKAKRDYFLNSVIEGASITAPETLSESEKKRYIERIKRTMNAELTTNYQVKEVEGQFKFYSKDGQPIFDDTMEMNSIKPHDLLKRDFSEFLHQPTIAPKKVTGTGGVDNATATPQTPKVVPSASKTRHDFYAYLQDDKGYRLGDKNFLEAVAKAKVERPDMFS